MELVEKIGRRAEELKEGTRGRMVKKKTAAVFGPPRKRKLENGADGGNPETGVVVHKREPEQGNEFRQGTHLIAFPSPRKRSGAARHGSEVELEG